MDLLGNIGPDPTSYWQAVITAAGLGVWDYDITTGEKHYSRRWHEIRDLTSDTPMPQTDEEWYDIVHPDDRAIARHYTTLINEGRADEVSFEYREKKPNGDWVWIMCRGRAIAHDAAGRAIRFVGVDTDITAMKKTEDERALYAQQLDLALTVGKIGIWQFNAETNAVTWDRRLRQIYGIPADMTPLPRDIWEQSIHPDDLETVLEKTAWGQSQAQDYDLDYRIIRRDGVIRHIRSRVSLVEHGPSGASYMGINWDLTDDIQRNLQLEEAKREAEERLYQLSLAHKELEYLSNHDPLTGLHNRRSLRAYLAELCPDGRAPDGTGFLLFDVDRFKRVNDRFGHAVGDEMIECVARALTEKLPEADIIARTGGDEFLAIIAAGMGYDRMVSLGQGVIDHARTLTRGQGEEMTVSVGIAMADATSSISDVLTWADRAMYKAKLMGGAVAALA
jgi:diguanylate cyclase (GGDEF)-like protein